MENFLNEAFRSLSLLEDNFNLTGHDVDKVDELKSFVADDIDEIPDEPIIDVEAQEESDLAENYVGKVILECECCHSRIYKAPDQVIIDKESNLANIDEECPVCNNDFGYTVIGKIEGFEKEPEEIEPEEEPEVEDAEYEKTEDDLEDEEAFPSDDIEEKDESLRSSKYASEDSKKLDERYYDSQFDKDFDDAVDRIEDEETEEVEERLLRNRHRNDEFEEAYDLHDAMSDLDDDEFDPDPWGKKDGELEEDTKVVKVKHYGHRPELPQPVKEYIEAHCKAMASYGKSKEDQAVALLQLLYDVFENDELYDVVYKFVGEDEYEEDEDKYDNMVIDYYHKVFDKYYKPNLPKGVTEENAHDYDWEESDEGPLTFELDDWAKKYGFDREEGFDEALHQNLRKTCKNKDAKGVSVKCYGHRHDLKEDVNSLDSKPFGDEDYEFDEDEFNQYYCDRFGCDEPEFYFDDIECVIDVDPYPEGYDDDEAEELMANIATKVWKKIGISDKEGALYPVISEDELTYKLAADYIHEFINEYKATVGEEVDGEDEDLDEKLTPEEEERMFELTKNGHVKASDRYEYQELRKKEKEDEQVNESVEVHAENESDVKVEKADDGSLNINVSNGSTDVEGGESIVPLTDEEETAIEDNSEEPEEVEEPVEGEEAPAEGEEDFDVEDFDEESFNDMGESFLRKNYSNVKSFKTTAVKDLSESFVVEGTITYKSGNKRNTSFVFTEARQNKNGKVILEGHNNTFSKSKKAFMLKGNYKNKTFVSESFLYNYTVKNLNESNKSELIRVNGKVKYSK